MKKLFLLIGLLTAAVAFAQSYTVDWHKIADGGGTSASGNFSISGTIGQPEAGGALTGGQFSVTGGYWSLAAVQTSGAPLLTLTAAGHQVIISWDASATGWTLQTNDDLNTDHWGDYTGAVVNNRATNSSPTGNLFFRLKQ